MNRADLVAGCIGTAIGAYAVWEAQRMPPDVIMKIGPGFFPTMLGSLLALASLALCAKALRASPGESSGAAPLRWSDPAVRRTICVVMGAVLFCAALKPVGFVPASLVFLVSMMWVFGNRRPVALALAPVIVTAAVWLVFEKLLHLTLPHGVLAPVLG